MALPPRPPPPPTDWAMMPTASVPRVVMLPALVTVTAPPLPLLPFVAPTFSDTTALRVLATEPDTACRAPAPSPATPPPPPTDWAKMPTAPSP